MAGITSTGVGSGLDVQSIVSQLMAIERQPLTALSTKEASYNAKISALGTIKSALSSLQTAAKALSGALPMKASSGDDKIFTASATGTAIAGNYAISVSHIADYAKIATDATGWVAADATKTQFQAGILTITSGTFADNGVTDPAARNGSNWSFTANKNTQGNDSVFTVNFAGGTLADLRDAINSTKDADGNPITVKAQIVTGQKGAQLVLTSNDRGAGNAIAVSGALDVSTDNGVTTAAYDFTYDIRQATQAAVREISIPWSTQVDIDGIRAVSNSNTITNAIPGVTLTVNANSSVDGGGNPVTANLAVARDNDTIKSNVTAFVTAYNALQSSIKTATAYDSTKNKASALTGDYTARFLRNAVKQAATDSPAGASGAYTRFSAIGVSIDASGVMKVDAAKLDAALAADPTSVQNLLSGYGKAVDAVAKANLDSDGSLQLRADGLNNLIRDLGKHRESIERRLDEVEKRYLRQFSSLDKVMSGMQSTSAYLSQQLARL